MPKRRITKRMLDAARLLADGMSPPKVAEAVGVSPTSVYRWMEDEDVMAEYRRCLRKGQVQAVAKAQRVLMKQMDSDAGNGFLAQNAASLITNRYAGVVMGEDKQEIKVVITGYSPAPGMPERTEDDD